MSRGISDWGLGGHAASEGVERLEVRTWNRKAAMDPYEYHEKLAAKCCAYFPFGHAAGIVAYK